MLKPGTDPKEGVFSGADWREFVLPGGTRVAASLPDTGRFVENAVRSHHWQTYQDFKERVGGVIEPFVGELAEFMEPWCLPRLLLRCAVPGSETMPVHYDQIFLRAAPPRASRRGSPLAMWSSRAEA